MRDWSEGTRKPWQDATQDENQDIRFHRLLLTRLPEALHAGSGVEQTPALKHTWFYSGDVLSRASEN